MGASYLNMDSQSPSDLYAMYARFLHGTSSTAAAFFYQVNRFVQLARVRVGSTSASLHLLPAVLMLSASHSISLRR